MLKYNKLKEWSISMKKLQKYVKYILWIFGGYILTKFLVFVGFNVNYYPMQQIGELPEQIIVEKAEASKEQGRIYGNVQNSSENNLNGKYIKITVFNSYGEIVDTEILKIENLGKNEQKMFKSNFSAKEAKSYNISLVNNN